MITFKVTPDAGEPYEITATSRDIYTWEKTTKGAKSYKAAVLNGSIVDLTEIAYYAARRQGRYTGSLTEFAQSHDIEGTGDEDRDAEPDPTQPAP